MMVSSLEMHSVVNLSSSRKKCFYRILQEGRCPTPSSFSLCCSFGSQIMSPGFGKSYGKHPWLTTWIAKRVVYQWGNSLTCRIDLGTVSVLGMYLRFVAVQYVGFLIPYFLLCLSCLFPLQLSFRHLRKRGK